MNCTLRHVLFPPPEHIGVSPSPAVAFLPRGRTQGRGEGALWGLLEGHEPHSRGIHPHDLITSPKPHLKPSRWAFEFHNIQIWQGLQTLSLYHYQAIPFLRSFKLEKLIYGWGEKTTAVLASVGTECGCEKAQEKRVEGRNVLCLHLPKPADSDT